MEEHFETLMAGSVLQNENLFMMMESKFDQRQTEVYHHDDVHHTEDDDHEHGIRLHHEEETASMKRAMEDISEADLALISSPRSPHKKTKSMEDKEHSLLIRIRALEHEVHKWKEMYEEERARRLEEQAQAYPSLVSDGGHLQNAVVYAPHIDEVSDDVQEEVVDESQVVHDDNVHDEHSRDHEHSYSSHNDAEDPHQIMSDVEVTEEVEAEGHDGEVNVTEDGDPHLDIVPEVHHVMPPIISHRKRRREQIVVPTLDEDSDEEELDECVDHAAIENPTEENWMKTFSELESLIVRKRRFPRLDYYHHPHIYLWINKQVERREKGELDERFVHMLTGLGFDWRKKRTVISWDEHFKKLTKIKEETNNFSLSGTKYHNNQTFFYWIRNQKRELKRGVVPPTRLEKLREIGFVDWVMGKAPINNIHTNDDDMLVSGDGQDHDPLRMTVDIHSIAPELESSIVPQRKYTKQELDKYPWRYWVPKLEEFKAKNGHLNPPFTNGENHDLACWVFYLRSSRRKNKAMPEPLIQHLDAMGFNWDLQEPVQPKKPAKRGPKPKKNREVKNLAGNAMSPVASVAAAVATVTGMT